MTIKLKNKKPLVVKNQLSVYILEFHSSTVPDFASILSHLYYFAFFLTHKLFIRKKGPERFDYRLFYYSHFVIDDNV